MANAQKLSPFGPALCAILCEWTAHSGGTEVTVSRASDRKVRVSFSVLRDRQYHVHPRKISADFYIGEDEARNARNQEQYAIKARQMIAALERT